MHLMIQNPGEAPVDGYTLLGVSTTRSSQSKGVIGQFGSGSKHAVNVLLRNSLSPVIFCGSTKLSYYTKEHKVDDGICETTFNKVFCKAATRNIDMGFVLEYGVQDWQDIAMAMREFISNAIDRTIREKGEFTIPLQCGDLVVQPVNDNQVRAKSGYTRVFIPMNPEVQRYYGELPKRFLHFENPELLSQRILPKAKRSLNGSESPMIYKHGVFVRQVSDESEPSIFDYNFGSELILDESRTVSDYVVKANAAQLFRGFAPSDKIATLIESIGSGKQVWEGKFDSYYLNPDNIYDAKIKDTRKGVWKEAAASAIGDAVVCSGGAEADFVTRKGRRVVNIAPQALFDTLSLVTANYRQVLSGIEAEGNEIGDAPEVVVAALKKVWDLHEAYGDTHGKTVPSVKCFKKSMNGGGTTFGYYKPGEDCVYVNEQICGQSAFLTNTLLEETIHYITGATDMSRDFQEYLLAMVTRLAF